MAKSLVALVECCEFNVNRPSLPPSLSIVLFESTLPKSMRKVSHVIIHNRGRRNAVIFATFLAIALATALSVVGLVL